ncbi:hypothetical protein IPH92_02040 [Candidatus Kaiserbacteria bacterium]|nr:MAG: hypothetical protein IPH92_02040 [Candidatus Kaiserbacteria bacterium]
MDSFIILVLTAVVLIVVALIDYFVKNLKKVEKEVVADLQNAQAKGESVYTIPEEYNNVSLGVGSGIKFGFGFGIGLFFAGIIIALTSSLFFGFTISKILSNV